jgi:RNA polymerase sigma factor (sigma-70 family)
MPARSLLLPPPTDAEHTDDIGPMSAVRLRSTKARSADKPASAELTTARPAADTSAGGSANQGNLGRVIPPMKPAGREFEKTKWSLVLRAGKASPDALKELCETYRAPLLAFARQIETNPVRAEDLVQGFLVRILEQKVVVNADPARGRFRAFLRTCLRNYAINLYHADDARMHHGMAGGDEPDFDERASTAPAADRLYDRAWARALLDRALVRLEHEQRSRIDRGAVFDALSDRLEGDDSAASLREAALKLGKSEGALKLSLFRLRRRYFDLVRAEVAATVAGPEDVDAELLELRCALRDNR